MNSTALREWYRNTFSLVEIENSRVLQFVFGATLLSYFVSFNAKFYSFDATVDAFHNNVHTCWPYFQSCGEWLFLRTLPFGYSQPFLYMVFFGLLVFAVYALYKQDILRAHIALFPVFVWHALTVFIFSLSFSQNYEYYLFAIATVLLFSPFKLFFLKALLVLLYFLSGVIKIHEGWVLGTYFSSLQTKLGIFPTWSIPIWTNAVILLELVGSWFLLSQQKARRRFILFFFVMFHLFSGVIVSYRFPVTVLPTLLLLFGPLHEYTKPPFKRKALFGWVFLIGLVAVQSVAFLIPGDAKLTLEGNRYGVYMFDANHQCVSTLYRHDGEGGVTEDRRETINAQVRCDPYVHLFRIKGFCSAGESIRRWTLDHSINGSAFLRIVDEEDPCGLEYKPFHKNNWIRTHEDNPPIIGYPAENIYR